MYSYIKLYYKFHKCFISDNIKHIKAFISEYYKIDKYFDDSFYNKIKSYKCNDIFKIILKNDIYILVSYIKDSKLDNKIKDSVDIYDYYDIPNNKVNKLIGLLENLDYRKDMDFYKGISDSAAWKLRELPDENLKSFYHIAYILYISIGFCNAKELLSGKYGSVDYEMIYYMFNKINVKNKSIDNSLFRKFLFNNKKDNNNCIRKIISLELINLFLNFDYFYNNFNNFKDNLNMNNIELSMKERYIASDIRNAKANGIIKRDMIKSYHNKYEYLDTPDNYIINNNLNIYDKYMRDKRESSIPSMSFNVDGFNVEILKSNDIINLVMGYRAGNCFRINGEASTLFYSFLKSKHMRIISISDNLHKDFAMVLLYRNGNTLVAQGIEISKNVCVDNKKVYDVVKSSLKNIMDYMNSNNDLIVATIIGRTNSNVANYNNNILPFIVSPILENSNNYYNGVDNYQCLLDLADNKSINDIKLYTPSPMYKDKEEVLSRDYNDSVRGMNYNNIEKILQSLRYRRFINENNNVLIDSKSNHSIKEMYDRLINSREVYTVCTNSFFITLFNDGTVDYYIDSKDKDIIKEFNSQLEKIKSRDKHV